MEQRNLILAIVISVAILLGFELLYNAPLREAERAQQAQQAQQTAEQADTTPRATGEAAEAPAPGGQPVPGGPAGRPDAPDRQALLDEGPRVEIRTPKITGSLSLVGGQIDDVTLAQYKQSTEPDSPRIDLLSPPNSRQAYYATFGWSAVGEAGTQVPGPRTRWQADNDVLTPTQDVTLSWTNDAGVTFERTYSVDEDYLFTITQRVVNDSGQPLSLAPYGLISRRGTPDILGFYILHEGPIGVLKGTLEEVDYDDLRDDGPVVTESTGGWLGITDKYWLVSLIPDQGRNVNTRFVHNQENGVDKYQTDYIYDGLRVEAGGVAESTSRLFAGAKEVAVLDRYKEEHAIPMFDKAVDFGWFYFLTKPLFKMLHFFAQLTGNFGVAILILVVIIKIVFFPLANKSYRSMAKLRNLQPEMVKLRERFGDDKQRLNQEMMALYKRSGANPASGCLPILIQIPVFFALYKVLFVTIEMRHAPFIGWIEDLSAKDPTAITNLFGLLPWGVPELGPLEFFNIGILPIVMGFTMYAQQLLNPQPADPMQARIFKLMPVFFTFILAQFPAGLVVYWTWNNLLTILQQYVIMKRAGSQIGGKQAAPAGGGGGLLGRLQDKAKEAESPRKGETGAEKAAAPAGDSPASSTTDGDAASGVPARASDADGEDAAPAQTPALATAEATGESAPAREGGERRGGTASGSGSSRGGGRRNPASKSGKGRGKGKKGRRR